LTKVHKLLVLLPKDRTLTGMLHSIQEDGQIAFSAPCRGKADNGRAVKENNPERKPVLPYGDTPSGRYKMTSPIPLQSNPRLGRWFIPMKGMTGDAAAAANYGRTGLGIHAGRGDDELIATYGCVRLRDSDMDKLAALLGKTKFTIEVMDI